MTSWPVKCESGYFGEIQPEKVRRKIKASRLCAVMTDEDIIANLEILTCKITCKEPIIETLLEPGAKVRSLHERTASLDSPGTVRAVGRV
jgi:hypothetical protein